MTVKVHQKDGYLFIVAHLDTVDSTDPDGLEKATIESGFPIYSVGVSVRMVMHVIMQEIERLWMHELKEWCKIGDVFMFGDPHA